MANTTPLIPKTVSTNVLSSPMRDIVRAFLFLHGDSASLSDLQSNVRHWSSDGVLPRNWRVQMRDVLKHDPDIEKGDDDLWLLRTQGAIEA